MSQPSNALFLPFSPATCHSISATGRWFPSGTSSLATGRASSAISLTVSSPYLFLRVGLPDDPTKPRKDTGKQQSEPGIGTARIGIVRQGAVLTWRVWERPYGRTDRSPWAESSIGELSTEDVELEAKRDETGRRYKIVRIFGSSKASSQGSTHFGFERKVEIMASHWSWTVQLDGIWVDQASSLIPFPSPSRSLEHSDDHHVLVISDSISVAFCPTFVAEPVAFTPGMLPTRGADDAWPFVAKRYLEQNFATKTWTQITVEVVGLPGITLVDNGFNENKSNHSGLDLVKQKQYEEGEGMILQFWRMTPWMIPASPHTIWSPQRQVELDTKSGLKRTSEHPDTIIIALGTNDRGWMIAPDQYVSQLRRMITDLIDFFGNALGTRLKDIVLMPPADHPEDVALDKKDRTSNPKKSYPDALREFVSSLRNETAGSSHSKPRYDYSLELPEGIAVHFCDVNPGGGVEEFLLDRVHPGKKGQEKVGKEVGKWLSEQWKQQHRADSTAGVTVTQERSKSVSIERRSGSESPLPQQTTTVIQGGGPTSRI